MACSGAISQKAKQSSARTIYIKRLSPPGIIFGTEETIGLWAGNEK